MSEREFTLRLLATIDKRFREDHPGYFIRETERDLTKYQAANQSGYSYYTKIMHSGGNVQILRPEGYHITDSDRDYGWFVDQEQLQAIEDAECCQDIRIWCFDHIIIW